MGWKHRRIFSEAQKKCEKNDLSGAEALYSQLIAENPKHAEAHLHRAIVRARMQKLDEALTDTERCIGLRPENGVMQMIRGEVLLEKKDFLAAYEALGKACELEKDNGRAFFQFGRAALALGRKEEAAEYFEVALQFERDYCLSQWMSRSLAKHDVAL